MAEPPAVDSSPLIVLSKADLLPILRLAGEEILLPRVVVEEIEALGEDGLTVRAVRVTSWLNQLRGVGLYLSDRIMNDALALVGE